MPDEPTQLPLRRHVRAEQVADLDAGLLPAAEAATVAAHLGDCVACRQLRTDVRADLAALGRLLADTVADPVPPMPAAVAERLDAAINAESAARVRGRTQSVEARREDESRPAPVVHLAGRRRLHRALAATLVAAAAIAGFVVVGDVLSSGTGGASSDSAADTADPGTADNPEAGATRSPANRPTWTGKPDQLSRTTFAFDATLVLRATPVGGQDHQERASEGTLARSGCAGDQLRRAEIDGLPGTPARLDGDPVTLVTTGPRAATTVVAYGCPAGEPVALARATVDLSR